MFSAPGFFVEARPRVWYDKKEVSMSQPILYARGVKKTYTVGDVVTEVLKGIDITVSEGQFVAVVGESGSGKSTLLYILAGIERPSEGEVVLAGRELSSVHDDELAAMRRREVSFVYQFDNLVPHLTAYENIVLPLLLDRKKEKDFAPSVREVCDFLGISDRLKNLPRQLSGGEQQRVALARALVTDPKLIFLDEPTGSLDSERGRQVMELLGRINRERGVALVMVTHSALHASYASEIIEIEDGLIRS